MKAKNDFVYFREFGKVEGIDCSLLTLQERLFLSVILTKNRYNDKRTYGQILFDYDEFKFSSKDFKAYDVLITDMLQKKYGKLCDYIVEHAKDKRDTYDKEDGHDKWIIHGIVIDKADLFATRNGKHGFGSEITSSHPALASLAWRAAALAASASKLKVTEWRKLCIYNWLTDEVTQEKKAKCCSTTLKRAITKWCEAVLVGGEFIGDYFVVDAKSFKNNTGKLVRNGPKEAQPRVKKLEEKPVIEETAKPEVAEEEEAIDEDEDLTPEEAEAEKEWRRQEASIDFTTVEEPEAPAFKYDKTDDWSKYSREDWVKWYDVTKANYEAKAAKADKDTPKWSSLLNKFYTPGSKYYDFVRHDGEEIKAIAKKLKVKVSDIDAVISGKRIEGADWQVKKDSIRRALKDLQDSVIMKAQDRDIWDADEYPRIAKIYVGFACKNYKYMKVDL